MLAFALVVIVLGSGPAPRAARVGTPYPSLAVCMTEAQTLAEVAEGEGQVLVSVSCTAVVTGPAVPKGKMPSGSGDPREGVPGDQP